jgi:hypothetical protein
LRGGLKGCGPAGMRTLASSSGARVDAHGDLLYACARATGRRYRLGAADRCGANPSMGPARFTCQSR